MDNTLRFNDGRELKITKKNIKRIEANFKVRPTDKLLTQNCLVDVSGSDIRVNIKSIDTSEVQEGTLRHVIDKILTLAEANRQGTIAIPPLIKKCRLIEWEAKEILYTVKDYFLSSDKICEKCCRDDNKTICEGCKGGSKLKTIIIVLPSNDKRTVKIYRKVFEELKEKYEDIYAGSA